MDSHGSIDLDPGIPAAPDGARVFVKARRARPLFARHPWVFAESIDRIDGQPSDGDEVQVCSHTGEFIARGLFNSQSKIRVRLFVWDRQQRLDDRFWRGRIEQAVRLRRDMLHWDDPRGACRLVFSEGDGLSGLIVDRYGGWLVVQFTSLALALRRDAILAHLVDLCQPAGIYLRTERGIRELEGLRLRDGPVWGEVPSGPVTIIENGLEFEVDLNTGQKTGFYLDQRENRQLAGRYAAGRRVLDAFCYTGAFAIAAARAGAQSVLGIDASQAAISLAQRNATRNQLVNVQFQVGQVAETLERLEQTSGGLPPFGMIVLDPPKFARQSQAVEQALRGYLRINLLATRLLEPDGLLVTCSCSGHVSRDDFLNMLGLVAEQSGRQVQVLTMLGQAADHPVSASCPESQYLKGVIARVT